MVRVINKDRPTDRPGGSYWHIPVSGTILMVRRLPGANGPLASVSWNQAPHTAY
jgi:hypothetical protein